VSPVADTLKGFSMNTCAHFGPAQEFMKNMPAGHVLQALPATNIIVSASQPESLLALVELFCG